MRTDDALMSFAKLHRVCVRCAQSSASSKCVSDGCADERSSRSGSTSRAHTAQHCCLAPRELPVSRAELDAAPIPVLHWGERGTAGPRTDPSHRAQQALQHSAAYVSVEQSDAAYSSKLTALW